MLKGQKDELDIANDYLEQIDEQKKPYKSNLYKKQKIEDPEFKDELDVSMNGSTE